MFIGLVLIASVPAYLAGFVALIIGMGWLASLGVVALTGTTVVILTSLFLMVRDGLATAPVAETVRAASR